MAKRIIKQDAPVNELLGKLQPEQKTTGKPSAPAEKAPEGYKLNPLYIETKTARLQLVLKPSLAKALKDHCKGAGISVNDYVGSLIERELTERI